MRILHAAMVILVCLAAAGAAQAQSAAYCEPKPGLRLLYTDRAYLIEPKAASAPALVYSYTLQGMQFERHVDRYGQFLFDDGGDRWAWLPGQAGKEREGYLGSFGTRASPVPAGKLWALQLRRKIPWLIILLPNS